MAWTDPRTWSAGEIPTATIFNTHVRDNLNALRHLAIVRRTAAIAATAAYADIPWDTEDVDDFSAWTGGSATRLTATEAGRYGIMAASTWTGATGGGSTILRVQRFTSASALVETWADIVNGQLNGGVNVSMMGQMNAGDYLVVAQNTGASGAAGSVTARAVFFRHG